MAKAVKEDKKVFWNQLFSSKIVPTADEN
jgi:hypothetical protein